MLGSGGKILRMPSVDASVTAATSGEKNFLRDFHILHIPLIVPNLEYYWHGILENVGFSSQKRV